MLPMDIEFIVQDVFALTRPQWKLASNLEEASRAFQLAMAQDQKSTGLDKVVEPEEPESDDSSDDGDADITAADADADIDAEAEEDSGEEDDADVCIVGSFVFVNVLIRRRPIAMVTPHLLYKVLTRRKRVSS